MVKEDINLTNSTAKTGIIIYKKRRSKLMKEHGFWDGSQNIHIVQVYLEIKGSWSNIKAHKINKSTTR